MGNIRKLFTDKRSIIFELGLLTFVLLNNQFYKQEDYMIRRYLYISCLILIILVSRIIGIDKKKLGLVSANWAVSLKQIMLPTALTCVFLVILYSLWPSLFAFSIRYSTALLVLQKILFYVVISVPMQELIFRGYFIYRLGQISNNKYFIILSSALIFGLVHAPFGVLLVTIGSFILGIIFAENFLRFRNLYALMVAHGIIGILFIYFINS